MEKRESGLFHCILQVQVNCSGGPLSLNLIGGEEMRRAFLAVVLGMLMIIGMQSCGQKNVTTGSYNLLFVAGESYELARATVIQLYKDGFIDDQERNKAIELSENFSNAYQAAVKALVAYEKDRMGSGDLDFKIANFAQAMSDFMKFLTPLIERRIKS